MNTAISTTDCERLQTAWFRARAELLGGMIWRDGPLLWTDGPDGQNLMFPSELGEAAIRRGIERAKDLRYGIVGAWLDTTVDASSLAKAGFERGWAPHWMTIDLDQMDRRRDPRIVLQTDTEDYEGSAYADYREQLALARDVPTRAWYAAAHVDSERRRLAGRAWSFLDGRVAGIFDMSVWPPFQRQGLGTGLLRAVCSAAAEAGADHAVLNATPEGRLLYRSCGFRPVGEGITWWLHLR